MKKLVFTLFIVVMVLALMVLPVSAASPSQDSTSTPAVDLLPEALTVLAAGVVALIFAYFPGLRTKYAGLATEQKSIIMILLLLILTGVMTGLSCAGVLQVNGFQCTKDGFIRAGWMFMLALAANQGTYKIFPETKDVLLAKQARYLESYGE